MTRWIVLSIALFGLWASAAFAEETPRKPTSDEQWLKVLRGSSSYREGMSNVQRLVEAAYDQGAIAGASSWDDIREYYISLARARGCEQGNPYAQGPIKACHHVQISEPAIVDRTYDEGLSEVTRLADDTAYPDVVRRVLVVLFDYGYVQGLKHGLRSRNDDIRWRQAYYRACISRANDAEAETPCAKGAKEWADRVLGGVQKRIDAHGLPAGERPK